MKFQELPGFSKLFTDYAEDAGSARSFFPWHPHVDGLRARLSIVEPDLVPRQELCALLEAQARRFCCGAVTIRNIGRLRNPAAAVVIARLSPDLFGGPLSDWLKIFTAARLASWLSGQGRPVVPIGCVDSSACGPGLAAGMLTRTGPRRFAIQNAWLQLPGQIEDVFNDALRALGSGSDDLEAVRIIQSAYRPGVTRAQAWAQSVSNLLDFCGIVICDPDESGFRELGRRCLATFDAERFCAKVIEQHNKLILAGYGPASAGDSVAHGGTKALPENTGWYPLMPVLAEVVDESGVFEAACAMAGMAAWGRELPVAWPRLSATILHSRDRKIIHRHGLDQKILYKGSEFIIENLMNNMNIGAATEGLDQLAAGLSRNLAEAVALAGSDTQLISRIERLHRRMQYQASKLSGRFSRAVQRRREAMSRQVSFVCDALAPWGSLQEREFAGFQFLFRHGRTMPEALYQTADIWTFEHQWIHLE